MKKTVIGICTALICGAPLAQVVSTDYTVLSSDGKAIGQQHVEYQNNGKVTTHLSYRDNGRGPDIDEWYTLHSDGTFNEYHVTGKTTFGSKIDEHFSRKGQQTRWWSSSEKGEKKLSSAALYWPLNGSFEPYSMALLLLQQHKGKTLDLLPGGHLDRQFLQHVDIRRGKDKIAVQLIALTGASMTPTFIWSTGNSHPRVFAYISPGFVSAIQKGFESELADLTKRQQEAEQVMLRKMASDLWHPLEGTTAIRHVRVFDAEKAQLGDEQDIYLSGGRITAVVKSDKNNVAADVEVDGQHRVAIPGLFDMHGHVSAWEGGLNIAAGVTTSRDMGNNNEVLQTLLTQIEKHELLSPQVVPTGFIEGESNYSARIGYVIKDLDGAKKAVDWYADHHYPQIKIYNSFPPAILTQTVAYAHQRGLRVSGHVPATLRAQDVVDAGFDEIQHINQLMLNFLLKPETDTRTLERFYLPARETANLDFDSKPVQDFIALLSQKQIAIDATLATFDFIRQRDGEVSKAYAAVLDHLPLEQQRYRRSAQMDIPDDATAALFNRSYEKMIDFVGRLYRAGVPLVAGTDEMAGFTLQRELELYVQAGLTPSQAIQVATWNGAKYSKVLNDRGSISVGKLADIVLLDGEPTQNIADIRKVAMVFTQGQWVDPRAIDRALGLQPFVEQIPAVMSKAK